MPLPSINHVAQGRAPLAVELLASDHSRRSLESELDEHLQADHGDFNPPSRRKDAELSRVLEILDSLEKGEGGRH